jgi:hypothetical protein
MSEERPSQRQRQRDEKQEKQEEKEEKSWEEKWRRDPLNAAVWALIIIWAGLVLLAVNFGLFEDSFVEAWPVFFLGAGVLLLLEVLFRLLVPAYRQPFAGSFVVAIGAYVLLRGILGRRQQ